MPLLSPSLLTPHPLPFILSHAPLPPPLPLFSLAPILASRPSRSLISIMKDVKYCLTISSSCREFSCGLYSPPPPNSPNPRPLSLFFYFVRLCLSFTGERKWVYLDKGGRAREKKEGKKLNEYYGICEYCNFLFFANFLLLFKILFLCVFFFSLV